MPRPHLPGAGAEPTVVLALNAGSSSLKFGLFRVDDRRTETLVSGGAESIGGADGRFHALDARGTALADEAVSLPGQDEAIVRIGRFLAESDAPAPGAVGHRIVHGGPDLRHHCLIDPGVLRQIEAAAAFAPLHGPSALTVIRFAQAHFPGVPQVACFDTTFHGHMPDVARTLPLPESLRSEGVRRYGFHGLSCESILHRLADDVPERMVIAHLGNGASVTAVRQGRSIDTSMGMTPTGGVVMGTRSGDLDPGVLAYLLREKRLDAPALEELVDRRSGLLGVSGLSGDMRRLHEAAPTNADARLAIAMFCYSVRKGIGAMGAALDGIDLLVFTGGIGENDARVRAAVCGGLSVFGITLDEGRNRSVADPLSGPASRCAVRVLAAQEDGQIARHARSLVSARAA